MEQKEHQEGGALAFGRHVYDPARCELRTQDGPPVALGQRAGRLLHALLDAAGRILSRDDLLQSAWPGQDVDDGNLRVQIAALRRALAEDRDLIGTVAGRGYLFAGQVERRGGIRPRLPQPAGCIGRDALVESVLARCGASRFVTLAGAAGIGKTAVALAAAHRHRGAAAWVELDAARIDDDVLAAVASALGVRDASLPALAARLLQPLLLVLDNCEHLPEACGRLAEGLLHHCPPLTVLATSRQPLLAQGETVVRVPPLALPPPGETDAGRLAACAAVQLFVQRAGIGAHDAGMLVTIAAICRRLDGLPLAIELAAARVPALGVDRVAAGLDDMLALLGHERAAVPRHRTLRAALDWSYVLLPEAARSALRHLARLPSWFTLEEAVALLDDRSPYDTIDSLASLAAHSLLVAEHGERTRYRLLVTTRAYALSRQET